MIQEDSPELMLFMQTEVLSGSLFALSLEGRLLDELNSPTAMGQSIGKSL